MDVRDFKYWLHGFFEISEASYGDGEFTPALNLAQYKCIGRHIDLVERSGPVDQDGNQFLQRVKLLVQQSIESGAASPCLANSIAVDVSAQFKCVTRE